MDRDRTLLVLNEIRATPLGQAAMDEASRKRPVRAKEERA